MSFILGTNDKSGSVFYCAMDHDNADGLSWYTVYEPVFTPSPTEAFHFRDRAGADLVRQRIRRMGYDTELYIWESEEGA